MATAKTKKKSENGLKDLRKNLPAGYNAKLVYTFLFSILLILFVLVGWILWPFVVHIIVAGVIASFFYPMYQYLLDKFKYKNLAALITTFVIVLLVIIPISLIFVYTLYQIIDAYNAISPIVSGQQSDVLAFINELQQRITFFEVSEEHILQWLGNLASSLNNLVIAISTGIVRGTTSFIFGVLIIFLTTYFLFTDGKTFVKRVMNLTPLPNKYDRRIFTTFRDVSFSALISTVVAGLVQAVIGAIGFWLAGMPVFFAAVLIFASSIIPYLGSGVIIIPAGIYLLLQGDITGAVILFVTGFVVGFSDNLVRAYMIKGKTKIHELIIFFSIIGGLIVFGFWGIVIGPIIVALLLTVLDIYEKEFSGTLELED